MTIRPAPPKITLDRVRPTVVRRRVFENSPSEPPRAPPALDVRAAGFADEYDDDESGPPSSVNVARALASLRGHELKRLDEILTRDDEIAPPAVVVPAPPPAPPAPPAVPTVRVGPAIALVELARRMSVTQEELVTALVTRGFFDVTVKTSLSRETAHAAASMFGWQVEDTDEAPPARANAKKTSKATKLAKKLKLKPKATAKTKAKPGAKPKAKIKPAARRTSRRA